MYHTVYKVLSTSFLTPVGFPLARYSHRAPREGRSHWHGGSHHLSVGQGSHNFSVGQGSHNLSVGQVKLSQPCGRTGLSQLFSRTGLSQPFGRTGEKNKRKNKRNAQKTKQKQKRPVVSKLDHMEVHENLRDLERDPASPGVPVAPVEVPVRMSAKCSRVDERRKEHATNLP
jgi:hypothetical protein